MRRLQFAHGSRVAERAVLAELQQAAAKFDRLLVVEADPSARAATRRRIGAEREIMQEQLAALTDGIDLSLNVARRESEERVYSAFEWRMAALDVAEPEERFAAAFVSNPRSGEFVKGHAVVLAELGLCPYRGQVVRDPAVFAGAAQRPGEPRIWSPGWALSSSCGSV